MQCRTSALPNKVRPQSEEMTEAVGLGTLEYRGHWYVGQLSSRTWSGKVVLRHIDLRYRHLTASLHAEPAAQDAGVYARRSPLRRCTVKIRHKQKAARRRLFDSNPMIVDQAAINVGFDLHR
jgi:hypothetical protein